MARKDGSTLKPVEPHPDLVGMKFKADSGLLVVTRTAPWSDAYMECEGRSAKTVRSVRLLHEHRRLHA